MWTFGGFNGLCCPPGGIQFLKFQHRKLYFQYFTKKKLSLIEFLERIIRVAYFISLYHFSQNTNMFA